MSKPPLKERRAKPRAVADGVKQGSSLDLKRIDVDRAAALDRFHRGGRRLSVEIAGETYEAAPLWPVPSAADRAVCATIATALGNLNVVLPWAVCLQQLERFAPGTEFDSVKPSVMALLIEATFEAEFQTLEAMLDLELEVSSVDRRVPTSPADIALQVTGADTRFVAALHDLNTPLLARLADRFSKNAKQTWTAIDLALPVRICLDAVRLGLSELRSLVPGDVVMLDGAQRHFLLVGDRLVAGFVPSGASIRLNAALTSIANSQWDWTMKDNDSSAGSVEDGTLDDVSVTLIFELGRKSLSVSEVRKLAAGSIVDIPDRTRETVSLVANGKRIGEGEIIRIGEGLGVRILSTGPNA